MSVRQRRGKYKGGRIFLGILFILLLVNAGNIGRFFFPFPYRETIFREAADAGIDTYLLAAIIKTESNFNPGAVSVKGACGLMQVMPETGRLVAGNKGIDKYSKDMLFDPEINIKIGAAYVQELYKEFNGNTIAVLAAYNAGRGNVKKWAEQGLWKGERNKIDQIPFPETRQFVRKVLFYQQTFQRLYYKSAEGKK